MTSFAQTDSTGKGKPDTIRVGGMVIIREAGSSSDDTSGKRSRIFKIPRRNSDKPANISTNWWILDLGFANYNDQTNYAVAGAPGGFAPGATEDNLKLRSGKSRSVNIWVFMQRINLVNHVVNLKYGLGVELNNYRYRQPIKYLTNPTQVIYDNTKSYSKNKLAADYITVPIMLNFNVTPHKKRGFGFSVGASGGYLYSSRQKTITNADGKQKEHDDFDLRQWKLSYIGELSLGWVKLYASIASQSMFEKGLDQTPYNFGLRLSNW
jgi:hypothetical protein